MRAMHCRYALTGVPELPGEKKVFFSSYYQGVSDVCFIHAVYDHIPERTGMDAGPNSEYWPRIGTDSQKCSLWCPSIVNVPGH
jgi:hypothetical protein